MMKQNISLLILFWFFPCFTEAQEDKNPCAEMAVFGIMDFWLGEWDVYSEDQLSGQNHIFKIMNSCALREKWTSATGEKGESLFYYFPASQQWKQVWFTENPFALGGVKEKVLISNKNNELVFQGSYTYNNLQIIDRTILKSLSPNEVHQIIQLSFDGGKEWKTGFYGIYKRKVN